MIRRFAPTLLLLAGCVTPSKEVAKLERAVKTFDRAQKRMVHQLAPGEVLTSEQLESFLTRESGPNQEGIITYTYPGSCRKRPPCTVVHHAVAAGRFVLLPAD